MIVSKNVFDRFIACLRIFGMLVAGAVLMAGLITTLSDSRSASGCGVHVFNGADLTALNSQH